MSGLDGYPRLRTPSAAWVCPIRRAAAYSSLPAAVRRLIFPSVLAASGREGGRRENPIYEETNTPRLHAAGDVSRDVLLVAALPAHATPLPLMRTNTPGVHAAGDVSRDVLLVAAAKRAALVAAFPFNKSARNCNPQKKGPVEGALCFHRSGQAIINKAFLRRDGFCD